VFVVVTTAAVAPTRAQTLAATATTSTLATNATDATSATNATSATAPVASTTETSAAAALPPDQRFKRGRSLFEYRDCPGAIAVLSELAVPGQLDDEREQLEVHRMLGVCFALLDQRREAAREFSSLLSIDPDHELDPFEVPPPVVDIFDAQKAAMKIRLAEIRRARERAREDGLGDEGGVLVERVTTVQSTPWASLFLPFGLAQLAQGEPVKAAVLGAAQGVGLLVNVVGFWGSLAVQQGAKDGFSADEASIENPLWYAHLVGLGVLGVSYGVGVADALWNREDQAVLADKQTKRPLTSAELKKLRRIERAPSPTNDDAGAPSTAPAPQASPSPPGSASGSSPSSP